MKHTILTVIAEIDPSRQQMLNQILGDIGSDLDGNKYIRFPALTLVHFASFVIANHEGPEPLLIFENNFDDETDAYFDELISIAGPGLHDIYSCCIQYVNPGYNPENLKKFLLANVVKPNTYHIGNVGRHVQDIKANQQLRDMMQLYLDKLFLSRKPATFSRGDLLNNLRQFVRNTAPKDLSNSLPPRQTSTEKWMYWTKIVTSGMVGLIYIALLLPFLPWLLYRESVDEVFKSTPTASEIGKLLKSEDRITQNHLAVVTNIKPGLFRLTLLRVVLFTANILARTSNKGKLSGVSSIHFAHWSIINRGKQLLFLSNYDGSWTSYLDDFIDKAHLGLTGIWSNTRGFPRTYLLAFGGATNEVLFKAFARNHQVHSLVWYSSYPDLTVQNIDKDSSVRENIFTPMSEDETNEWLKKF